jgi:hypothetical protein
MNKHIQQLSFVLICFIMNYVVTIVLLTYCRVLTVGNALVVLNVYELKCPFFT